MKYPAPLTRLIQILKHLPGVGAKSAERFAFHMLEWSPAQLHEFGQAAATLPSKIGYCPHCGCLREEKFCQFCEGGTQKILSIVGSARDVYSIEETGEYRGFYHVLGALLSPLEGIGPEQLNLDSLKRRIQSLDIEEVIIALDATLEGDATALFLKQELEPLNVPVSRLAFGLPMGSSFEYVDGGTLARAFCGRSTF